MKRNDLLRHLHNHGCVLVREGGNHSIYQNLQNSHKAPVGRHPELDDRLCQRICRQLGIPVIGR